MMNEQDLWLLAIAVVGVISFILSKHIDTSDYYGLIPEAKDKGLPKVTKYPPMPKVKQPLKADYDLKDDVVHCLEDYKAVQQYRGSRFSSSIKHINKLIERVKLTRMVKTGHTP